MQGLSVACFDRLKHPFGMIIHIHEHVRKKGKNIKVVF